MKNLFWILPTLFLVLGSCSDINGIVDERSTVRIKNGTLAGLIMKSRKGREFVGFRGIPYALPPLGELRFEPPKPMSSWNGVRQARDDASICIQRNIYTHQEEIVGEEDCLYLNVYTPKLPTAKRKDNDVEEERFPVMIWFHGGGWVTGAGHSEFYGPKFLLDHDVVLVTVNFRLGPLGFLSTEDLVSPGNQGMKDQAQSIRWVHENIAAFGGDPGRVTLFGESAGGASANFHMISSLSKGLFQRAISQSGTAHCPWTLTRPGEPRKKAQKVAELLNCPSKDSKEILKCLRTRSAVDIIGTDRSFQVFDYCPMIPFRPVIEPDHPGAFLKEDPAVAVKFGRLVDISWMTGITSQEGSLRVPSLYGMFDGKLIKELNDDFMRVAPITLLYGETCPKELLNSVSKSIRNFYFVKGPIDNSTRFDVIDMYSDAWFNHAAHVSVRDHLKTQSSPVYYYYFSYKGSASFSKIFGDAAHDYGVSHADDLQYLFPVGEQLFPDTPLSENDHRMIDIMTTLWYNFAKSGNPTPELTKTITAKWKPVATEAMEYYHIGNLELSMADHLLRKRNAFWDTLPIRKDLRNIEDEEKQRRFAKEEL